MAIALNYGSNFRVKCYETITAKFVIYHLSFVI